MGPHQFSSRIADPRTSSICFITFHHSYMPHSNGWLWLIMNEFWMNPLSVDYGWLVILMIVDSSTKKSWFIHYRLMNVNECNDIGESTSHNQSFNSSPSPLSRTRPLPQLRQLVSSSKHGRTRTTTLTRQMVHGKPKHRNQTASSS